MKNWKARVYIGTGSARRTVEVQVQAQGALDAKAIFEAQHGKGNVASGPFPA